MRKATTIAIALFVSMAAYGQWSRNTNTSPATVHPTNFGDNVVIGGNEANALMRLTLVGAETLRFGPNPYVRLFDFDFNQYIGATQARNGAAMRIDLRWGAPDNFSVPAFQWFIRGDNEAFPNNTETQKMYMDKNGMLAIGFNAMTGDTTNRLQVNGHGSFAGNITAGGTITAAGNITAVGTISGGNVIAKYQDVAEWVPAEEDIAAATVVVLDPERSNHVIASSTAYDETVAGVVSARPGIILGEGGDGSVKVATTGRVKVKADATKAAIRIGDLLVTSGKPGMAMKSERIEVGGMRIHRPGTVVGKALEPLAQGEGEILVLLSLQ
ncbi:MAG TPA: hypothetical protein VGR02_10990 [Thermoanaerobaculia bacterium]|nr:hypothetical protein [Thermoanaerobaculia bacterium]